MTADALSVIIKTKVRKELTMLTANGIEGKFLTYKGLPLVRQDNEIYYGDMTNDKYYLSIMIMKEEMNPAFGISIPTKVMIQVCASEDGTPLSKYQKIVGNLAEAFEFGCPWLERANRE